MAKVRLQWKPSKTLYKLSDKEKDLISYKSSWDVLTKVFKSQGYQGLYSGLSAQIMKAVFCQAILFVSKEKLTHYTRAFLIAMGVLESMIEKKVST